MKSPILVSFLVAVLFSLSCFATTSTVASKGVGGTGSPGDVVSIELLKLSAMPPTVRFGLSEVAVVDAGDSWIALIGLDLTQLPGEYIVYARQPDTDEPATFIAFEVLNRDYGTTPITDPHISKLPEAFPVKELSSLGFANTEPPALPFRYPIASNWHTHFGARVQDLANPKQQQLNFIHTDAPFRTLVRAPQRGIVSNIIQNTPNNATVVIDHGQQVFSILQGLDDLTVEIGNGIEANAVIAKVPVTTNIYQTAPIVWQLKLNGVFVNPLSLITIRSE